MTSKTDDKRTTEQDAIEEFRKYVLPHWDRIRDVLVNTALAGDVKAIELIAKVLVPAVKPVSERVSIPGLASASSIEAKADAVLRAIAGGKCSVEAGEKALAALAAYSRAADFEKRLRALEAGRAPKRLPASAAMKPSPKRLAPPPPEIV